MATHQEYLCDGAEGHQITAPRQDDAKAAAHTKENLAGRSCPVGWCRTGRLWAVGAGSVALNEAGRERLEKARAQTAHLRKTAVPA